MKNVEKYTRILKRFNATFSFHTLACMKLICIKVAFIYSSRNCEQKDYASQVPNVIRTESLDKTHDANQCLSAMRCPARDISATGISIVFGPAVSHYVFHHQPV